MDMNGIGSAQIPVGIYRTGLSLPIQENNEGSQYADSEEKLEISPSGKIINAIAQMSEEERAEMHAFHQEMMDSMMDGTFDASELAASAPETLKAIAEESGIELEQMIQDMASGPQRSKGAPPPPPPMMSVETGSGTSLFEDLTEEETAEMETFLQEMMDSMMDGTFDASELAASAPETLKAIAEESGIELEQMIQDMASGPQKSEGAPPPPPPGMYMSDGSATSFSEDYDSDLLGNFFTDEENDAVNSIGES